MPTAVAVRVLESVERAGYDRRHTRLALPLADWTNQLGAPAPEAAKSKRLAHVGGIAAVVALLAYLLWRINFTLPLGGSNRTVAWLLISFEAIPLAGLVLKTIALWNIDTAAPDPARSQHRVVLMIPTYNEPVEVIAPTIAAACNLEPPHATWVLDDGDRPWVAELCAQLGARYVSRPVHDYAKAGNMNHALAMLDDEDAGDLIAVVDCDHVPLPTFLTATLGWFNDERVAIVQGPQAFFNTGAFDDDGYSGEQGLFFNVLMPARQAAGVGPFWCGSTALLRVTALKDVGGVATETITEDMHTTIKLQRLGWRTVYHHQTLAVGLAPATPTNTCCNADVGAWAPCRSSCTNGCGLPNVGCHGATTTSICLERCGGSRASPRRQSSPSRLQSC